MKEMKVFKDGDQWIFALPDFKNMHISPCEIAQVKSQQNYQMDLSYRNLELDQEICNTKAAIDRLHQQVRMQK